MNTALKSQGEWGRRPRQIQCATWVCVMKEQTWNLVIHPDKAKNKLVLSLRWYYLSPTVAPGESLETLQEQSSLGPGIRHPPRGEWVKKIQQVDTVGFAKLREKQNDDLCRNGWARGCCVKQISQKQRQTPDTFSHIWDVGLNTCAHICRARN